MRSEIGIRGRYCRRLIRDDRYDYGTVRARIYRFRSNGPIDRRRRRRAGKRTVRSPRAVYNFPNRDVRSLLTGVVQYASYRSSSSSSNDCFYFIFPVRRQHRAVYTPRSSPFYRSVQTPEYSTGNVAENTACNNYTEPYV